MQVNKPVKPVDIANADYTFCFFQFHTGHYGKSYLRTGTDQPECAGRQDSGALWPLGSGDNLIGRYRITQT